jgi:hypothetical protein
MYAFAIQVTNPKLADLTPPSGWFFSTVNSKLQYIDSTRGAAPEYRADSEYTGEKYTRNEWGR